MSKEKARLAILSELLSFPMIRNKDWIQDESLGNSVRVGDLVAMSCAPSSKWYLSWLIEIEIKNGYQFYILESIEDGELCRWSNVTLTAYDREIVANSPNWKWTDKQYGFYSRWIKACKRNYDYRLRASGYPIFNDDGSVILSVRPRIIFGDGETVYSKKLENWKKLTIKEMGKFYLECSKTFKDKKAA